MRSFRCLLNNNDDDDDDDDDDDNNNNNNIHLGSLLWKICSLPKCFFLEVSALHMFSKPVGILSIRK